MLGFLKLILAFAPWLLFLIIARGSMFRLELGLGVALALSILMGVLKLHRGVILWVGLTFFSLASVLVIGFHDIWTARHMGILANCALALGTWIGVVRRKPFTLDYAKEHTDSSLWNSPAFLRSNMIISSVWGGAFTINALLAWMKMKKILFLEMENDFIAYGILLGTAFFTQWYPARLRRKAAAGDSRTI